MAGQIFKLQTNIPIVGTVDYVDYAPSRNTAPDGKPYADQIAVRGKFDVGEGRVYLPIQLEETILKTGIVGPRQQNGNYPILKQGTQVKITRTENGNKKFTNFEIVGAGSPSPQQSTPTALYGGNRNYTASDKSNKERWQELTLLLSNCLVAASEIWEKAGGSVANNCREIQASAATLFIACRQSNITPEGPTFPEGGNA